MHINIYIYIYIYKYINIWRLLRALADVIVLAVRYITGVYFYMITTISTRIRILYSMSRQPIPSVRCSFGFGFTRL